MWEEEACHGGRGTQKRGCAQTRFLPLHHLPRPVPGIFILTGKADGIEYLLSVYLTQVLCWVNYIIIKATLAIFCHALCQCLVYIFQFICMAMLSAFRKVSPFYRGGNRSSERLSNFFKVTQRIIWIPARTRHWICRLQYICMFNSMHHSGSQ